MMRKNYQKPDFEVIRFGDDVVTAEADVINSSEFIDPDEGPIIDEN